MGFKRKQYVLDKAFQMNIAVKAIIFPLITLLIISSVLIYFAINTNKNIDRINTNQSSIIDTFLSIPQLSEPDNPITRDANIKFQENLGKSKEIQRNSRMVLYFLIIMTIAQTVIIFTLAIFFTHKISGPIYVMRRHLRDIREGRKPNLRPLRQKDQFKEFYGELCETIDFLTKEEKKKK